MFMPMTPLQSWALILLMILAVIFVVSALADWSNPNIASDEDASHDEGELEGLVRSGKPRTETRLYDWAVDGI